MRRRTDLLSMHTGSLAFIEALLVGIAVRRPEQTMPALQALNDTRQVLAGKPPKV